MKYKPTIGLEIHVELKTESKMFCTCRNMQTDTNGHELEEPNTVVCPVCMGFPGTLPVINKKAVEYVLKTALALDCRISGFSKFDRKNYFYPDLPKGYQISQYDLPLTKSGFLNLSKSKKIRIRRIHLEEDTGKLIHPEGKDYSLVDFNRAGVPLMEIVTEPDIELAKEAGKFCRMLQLILRYLKVSNADMEKGEMRCEVNISLMPANKNSRIFANKLVKISDLGTKVEIKNLNSFRAVEGAIEHEIKRQTEMLNRNEKVIQETRGWDPTNLVTISQRIKEEAQDYRYFPEPDLPPLKIDRFWVSKVKSEIPELPYLRQERFIKEYDLTRAQAKILVANKDLGDYFERVISETKAWLKAERDLGKGARVRTIKLASNWILSNLQNLLKDSQIKVPQCKISPENFSEFIEMLHEQKISSTGGQKVLLEMFKTGKDPSHIIEEKNLAQVGDKSVLGSIVDKAIKENEIAVEDFKKGKVQALKFLVGQVMRESKGRANPQVVERILREKLK